MNAALVGFGVILLAISQSQGPSQKAGNCSVNISGGSNTASVTCNNVDRRLAQQIRDLLNGVGRNEKATKELSIKLDLLLKSGQVRIDQGPGSAASFNQSGGITAGQVTITGPGVKIAFAELSANQQQGGKDNPVYVSRFRVSLSGTIPDFVIAASAPSLVSLDLGPEEGGIMTMVRTGTTPNGAHFHRSQGLYGNYILTLRSSQPDSFHIEYQCQGVVCVGP